MSTLIFKITWMAIMSQICDNLLTILDPGIVGICRGLFWACWVSNWDPAFIWGSGGNVITDSTIATSGWAGWALGSLPEFSERCSHGSGVKWGWEPKEQSRAWHSEAYMDLTEHSVPISMGFFTYLLDQWQLTGTRQTLAKYFGHIEVTIQISKGTVYFMWQNKTWDHCSLQQ